jgi:hypothetical protein
VLPYPLVNPYSKLTVVLAPLDDTVPFSVTPVVVIDVAGSVVAVGDATGALMVMTTELGPGSEYG